MTETAGRIQPVRIYGDPVLRRKADRIEAIDGKLHDMVQAMLATLERARGLGLAAPQIGRSCRVCVVNLPALDEKRKQPLVLINPEIGFKDGKVAQDEGCLSFPQVYAEVARPRRIGVSGVDGDGREIELEADELLARVLMHEIDHLNGVLFIDHLSVIKRQLLRRQLKELAQQSRPGGAG